MIKCMRNDFIKKGNYFKHPTLVLSNGEVLEEGICTINWVKELCNKNKNELISSCRIHKSTVNPDKLSKQKLRPDLAFLSAELTKSLELECGEKAKGACKFLAFTNKHTTQPLTATNPKKGHLMPKAKTFFSSKDKRLDCMIETSDWMQNSCHPSVHDNGLNEEGNDECDKVCFIILFEFKINT